MAVPPTGSGGALLLFPSGTSAHEDVPSGWNSRRKTVRRPKAPSPHRGSGRSGQLSQARARMPNARHRRPQHSVLSIQLVVRIATWDQHGGLSIPGTSSGHVDIINSHQQLPQVSKLFAGGFSVGCQHKTLDEFLALQARSHGDRRRLGGVLSTPDGVSRTPETAPARPWRVQPPRSLPLFPLLGHDRGARLKPPCRAARDLGLLSASPSVRLGQTACCMRRGRKAFLTGEPAASVSV